MMERDTVWKAMATAYRGAEGDLPDRLMAALAAGQGEGGDIRGMQSAAIVVVAAEPTGTEWGDRLLDLRVEDHATPVDELARLVRLWRAYGHAERAEELELTHDLDGAMRERFTPSRSSPTIPSWRSGRRWRWPRPVASTTLAARSRSPTRRDPAGRSCCAGWSPTARCRSTRRAQALLDEAPPDGTGAASTRPRLSGSRAAGGPRGPRSRPRGRGAPGTRGSGTSSGSDSRSGASPRPSRPTRSA